MLLASHCFGEFVSWSHDTTHLLLYHAHSLDAVQAADDVIWEQSRRHTGTLPSHAQRPVAAHVAFVVATKRQRVWHAAFAAFHSHTTEFKLQSDADRMREHDVWHTPCTGFTMHWGLACWHALRSVWYLIWHDGPQSFLTKSQSQPPPDWHVSAVPKPVHCLLQIPPAWFHVQVGSMPQVVALV
jgi:hypothetical protein